ncbi:hypothetical protein F1D05_24025 [Kribbella qitaiheensis]|uniref:AzlD domain-containing protein n=1 Tax=Kribbella qitaiheensis TaxID=1544730 RepID=A0A7G6X2E9_9ACTN|nr:hypothetical protein [Kribbella qitaiheensis]QNE20414.1 hypothetical protein F1D05_24025 [Kribbella qitaiheensis]
MSRRHNAFRRRVLLAGLIVTQLGGPGWHEVDWTKLAGVGAAGGLCLAKVPMLVAVADGIVVTALLRLSFR